MTLLPEEGTIVGRGEVIIEIDGSATRALIGTRPAWRRMAVGMSDGEDVAQLNSNLEALGFAKPGTLSDDKYDWKTRQAVRQWQTHLELNRTGVVELGDVVFLPSEVRVGDWNVKLGDLVNPNQTLSGLAIDERVVTIALNPALRDSLSIGQPVKVTQPNKVSIAAEIRSIGQVVSASEESGKEPSVKVEVEFLESSDVTFDATPVDVVVDRVLAENVLVVPVSALLASQEHGYVIERVTVDGVEIVPVEPGLFAEGLVEVTGEIAEGEEIVVPR